MTINVIIRQKASGGQPAGLSHFAPMSASVADDLAGKPSIKTYCGEYHFAERTEIVIDEGPADCRICRLAAAQTYGQIVEKVNAAGSFITIDLGPTFTRRFIHRRAQHIAGGVLVTHCRGYRQVVAFDELDDLTVFYIG